MERDSIKILEEMFNKEAADINQSETTSQQGKPNFSDEDILSIIEDIEECIPFLEDDDDPRYYIELIDDPNIKIIEDDDDYDVDPEIKNKSNNEKEVYGDEN